MSERSNIRDVAALAGVAVKTVSRVLNNHPYVATDTKARVEEAMRSLDFRPSIAARILSGAKSNQIALIYDNHSPYYMFQIQTGCWSRCQEGGIRLLAQPVDVADPMVGEQVRGLVSETHVDGIILSSPVTDCEPVLRALATFGEEIGVVFQLSDDIIDITSDATGKTPGTDLREGVWTLPTLLVQAADDPADARLRELIGRRLTDPDELAEALALMRAHPALARAQAEVDRRAQLAKELLSQLPECAAREALFELCDHVVSRST